MPGEAAVAEPAGVLMLSAEDGVADTIRPRLEAAGADLQRCVVMTASRDHQGRLHPVSLPADIPAITRAAQGISARLIVVDPLMAFLDGRVDAHRDQDVRGALRTLAELAEITGAALLILRHLNKAAGGNPIYRGGGSIGIIGAARVGLLVAPDPSDKARRVLAVTKSNLAAIPPALVYRLVPTNDTSAVQWEGEATCGAADLLAAQDETTEARGARQEAEVFLRDLLENGPVSAVDVKRQAAQAGVAWATVRRAADQIGVQRLKVGMKQGWFWSLPPEGDQ
jgi:hypothetical protein